MELQTIFDELTALRNEVKSLTKLVRKVRSVQDDPDGEKAAARSKNNGFNRLSEIDSALREFLGLAEGEMIARSEVTKRINAYIKDNNLKHPDNGRVIVMDDKLKKLLNPSEDVQITFLNLQKYISPHYVKTVVPDAPVPVAEEAPKTVKKVVKRPVVRKPAATA